MTWKHLIFLAVFVCTSVLKVVAVRYFWSEMILKYHDNPYSDSIKPPDEQCVYVLKTTPRSQKTRFRSSRNYLFQ